MTHDPHTARPRPRPRPHPRARPHTSSLLQVVVRCLLAFAVVGGGVGVAHATTLGGIESDQLASFNVAGTVPIPTTTTTTTTTTTVPSAPPSISVPTLPPLLPGFFCFGSGGYDCFSIFTRWDDITWIDGDVTVYGRVRGDINVVNGDVHIADRARIDGDITQSGPGGVNVYAGGTVIGSITESDGGSVYIDGDVRGTVSESGDGDVAIDRNGRARQNVTETGSGSLIVAGRIDGSAVERDAGDLSATSSSRVDEVVDAGPTGSCFLDPGADLRGGTAGDCA